MCHPVISSASSRQKRPGEREFLLPAIKANVEQVEEGFRRRNALCENTVVSFEAHAPSLGEMEARIQKITEQFPWLVCTRDGEVLGYAYACPHRERSAYRWSVDVAVYVDARCHRPGVGRALYTALIKILALQGHFKACAGITLPNAASIGLHEALAFRPVGVYRGVGYKLGAWRDAGWWQLALQDEHPDPTEPRGVRLIEASPGWQGAREAGARLLRA